MLKPHNIIILIRAQAATETAQAAANKNVVEHLNSDSDPESIVDSASDTSDTSSRTDQDNLDPIDSLYAIPIQPEPINEENEDNSNDDNKEIPL